MSDATATMDKHWMPAYAFGSNARMLYETKDEAQAVSLTGEARKVCIVPVATIESFEEFRGDAERERDEAKKMCGEAGSELAGVMCENVDLRARVAEAEKVIARGGVFATHYRRADDDALSERQQDTERHYCGVGYAEFILARRAYFGNNAGEEDAARSQDGRDAEPSGPAGAHSDSPASIPGITFDFTPTGGRLTVDGSSDTTIIPRAHVATLVRLICCAEELARRKSEYPDDSPCGKLLPALGCLIREHHGFNYGVTSHTRSVIFDYFMSVGILTPELYEKVRKNAGKGSNGA